MEVLSRRAAVSAEDLVAVVRVHADRVHDAVRRLGCDGAAAVQVVEESALDLVEAVAHRPEQVADAVGWWVARARALARRVATRTGELPLGGGVLAGDEDQEVLAEALEQLPEDARLALLLRDSYDLPVPSVAAALGADEEQAMERVARARLAFLPLVDDEPAPAVPSHQTSLAALARIAEAGPVSPGDAPVRRHALSCAGCRAVTDALQRAHLLLVGLTVVALPEGERTGLLERVEQQAYAALPTAAQLVLAGEEEELAWDDEDDDDRRFSPLLALLSIVLAVLLGLGAGLLLARSEIDSTAQGVLPQNAVLPTPPPQPTPSLASPPALAFPAPETTVFVITPPPPPEPTPAVTTPPAPQEELGISVDPASGPNGAVLTVSGTGWTPGVEVLLEYLDPTGTPTGSQTTVVADARGRFTAELTAQDPNNLPGEHTVRASDGEVVAEATYDAQA